MLTIRSDLVENIDNACSPWKPYNYKSPNGEKSFAPRYASEMGIYNKKSMNLYEKS